MKKLISVMLTLFLVAALTVLPVSANNHYDSKVKGSVTVRVIVPDGFKDIVFLSLMDSAGGGRNYAVLPESNYLLVEDIVCGAYRISGYVNNDPLMKFTVLRNMDTIEVKEQNNPTITLTVTGGPSAFPPETVPDTTKPPETSPTAPTQPSEPESKPTDVTEVTEPEEKDPTAPSEGQAKPNEDGDADKEADRPFWVDLLISLAAAGAFVGIVAGCVHLYRRHTGFF